MNMRKCPCRSLEAKDTTPGFDGAENGEKEYKKLRGMELHEEDADGWHYRGEGAANVVLSYHGSRPSFVSVSAYHCDDLPKKTSLLLV